MPFFRPPPPPRHPKPPKQVKKAETGKPPAGAQKKPEPLNTGSAAQAGRAPVTNTGDVKPDVHTHALFRTEAKGPEHGSKSPGYDRKTKANQTLLERSRRNYGGPGPTPETKDLDLGHKGTPRSRLRPGEKTTLHAQLKGENRSDGATTEKAMVRKLREISKEQGLDPHDPSNPYYTRPSTSKAASSPVQDKPGVSSNAGIDAPAIAGSNAAKPVEPLKSMVRGAVAEAGDALVEFTAKLGPLSVVGDALMIHSIAKDINFLTGQYDKGDKLPLGSKYVDSSGNQWRKEGPSKWVNSTSEDARIKTDGA